MFSMGVEKYCPVYRENIFMHELLRETFRKHQANQELLKYDSTGQMK